ncbi:SAM-dependent methyltransferase [Chitinophaga sp. OAE865]
MTGRLLQLPSNKYFIMIEIFKTNIPEPELAENVLKALKETLPGARINFDHNDRDKILRVEASEINTDAVISTVRALGFVCILMEDKVCIKSKPSSHETGSFWESSFIDKQTMWGFEPADSTLLAKDFFIREGIKDVLIPGIGYGRNAKVFIDNGIKVTGIEISKTAIDLARAHYGNSMKIYHGSVTDMPFDHHRYGGIFSYGLIYLLDEEERKKLIRDCYDQLQPNGYLFFSVISKNSPNYGAGTQIGKDRFEATKGARIFFYDNESVREEFGEYGLTDFFEIEEPNKTMPGKPSFRFIIIKCRKGS